MLEQVMEVDVYQTVRDEVFGYLDDLFFVSHRRCVVDIRTCTGT